MLSDYSDGAYRAAEALSDYSDDAYRTAEVLSEALMVLPELGKCCRTTRTVLTELRKHCPRKKEDKNCVSILKIVIFAYVGFLNQSFRKKVKTIGLTNLRTEENFGFQMDVKKLADELLPTTGSLETEGLPESSVTLLTDVVEKHEAAVTDLDGALKDSASVPSGKLAAEAELERDSSWRGLNNYVKAMTAYPEGTLAEEALAAKALIDKYGDPTDKPQTEESGILHNLIQDLEAGKEESFPNLQVDVWITDLKNKNQKFLDYSKTRTEEEAARQVGIVKEKTLLVNDAYRKLIETVNAMTLLHGEEKFAAFIDQMNVLIDRQKTVLKTRATVNANKKKD